MPSLPGPSVPTSGEFGRRAVPRTERDWTDPTLLGGRSRIWPASAPLDGAGRSTKPRLWRAGLHNVLILNAPHTRFELRFTGQAPRDCEDEFEHAS